MGVAAFAFWCPDNSRGQTAEIPPPRQNVRDQSRVEPVAIRIGSRVISTGCKKHLSMARCARIDKALERVPDHGRVCAGPQDLWFRALFFVQCNFAGPGPGVSMI